mmetsp:Transcript_79331/g.220670  ORF Transcript_79331/g.220670 Transcript_79331/m.220670 type:complete len:299 (+) Transcript_79331:68-964(+)
MRRVASPLALTELLLAGQKEKWLCELVRDDRLLEEHRTAAPWSVSNRHCYLEAARAADGQTPLHIAAGRSYHHLLRDIVAGGARVDLKDHQGRTALMVAAAHGQIQSVTALLGLRADANAIDNSQRRALHHAVHRAGDPAARVVEVLLRARAEIDARSHSGLTPLAVASAMEASPCIEVLLKHSAAPLALDRDGRTPFEHARLSRRLPAGSQPVGPTAVAAGKLPPVKGDDSVSETGERPVAIRGSGPTWSYPCWDHVGDGPHERALFHTERSWRRKAMPELHMAERDRLHSGRHLLC